jgi:hypothetical protein
LPHRDDPARGAHEPVRSHVIVIDAEETGAAALNAVESR